jgi:hypothetical protein
VLRRIYERSSDLDVSANEIAAIIDQGLNDERQQQRERLKIYQEAIQAVDMLSKPPLWPEKPQRERLRSMLSDRLEAINDLARRLTDTGDAQR